MGYWDPRALLQQSAMATEVEETPGRRIAIAVDRSDESVDALKWALEKVCHKGDKLVVLHATCPLEG